VAFNLLVRPNDPSPVHFPVGRGQRALLVIVFFMIATARAWQMIGARETRALTVVGNLMRERNIKATVGDPVEDEDGDVAPTDLVAANGSATRVRSK
jgi:hypothetical protein